MAKTSELDLSEFSNLLIGNYLGFGALGFGALPILNTCSCNCNQLPEFPINRQEEP